MTYSEFRNRFNSKEEFKEAFGKLSEEEARKLIAAEPGGTTVKACAMATWRRCAEEVNKKKDNRL